MRAAGALALLVACLAGTAFGFFEGKTKVTNLTPDNFETEVLNSDQLWIVEFYAPWCGHCKNLAPEWEKAAKALSPNIRLGAVDADKFRELGSKFDVSGFPTIKVFGGEKSKPTEYEGGRTVDAIIEAALAEAKKMAYVKAGIKEEKKVVQEEPKKDGVGFFDGSDVVELTDANWDKEVGESKEAWLVEFYAPWCGHCKNLAPEWKKAATELLGSIKIAAVDVTAQKGLGDRFKVQSFPTLKFFAPGSSEPEDYTGGRSAADIVAYGEGKAELYPSAPPKIDQVADQAAFEALCEGRPLCVIFMLPHVIDTGAKGRNAYIDMFQDVAGKLRARKAAFGWIVGGDHHRFEEGVGIFASYPTFVAVNTQNNRFYTHRGAFTADAISDSLKKVLDGKIGTRQAKALPKFSKGVELWDGKDYVAPADDE